MSSVYVTSSTPKYKPVVFRGHFKVVRIYDEGTCDESIAYGFSAGHYGYISICDRMTGFGWRDVETGFCDIYAMNARGKNNYGKNFWLASGNFDIRSMIPDGGLSWDGVVRLIKQNANSCIGEN